MSDSGETLRLIARADDKVRHGDLLGAIALYKQVLSEDPQHAYAHAMLAICLVDAKQLGAARVEAEAAVHCDPEAALSHRAMGEVERAERKLDKAEASYRYAISLEPEDAGLHVRLIALLRLRERRDEELLREAMELAPDDPDVLVAAAYDAYDRKALDEAERHATEALEEDPEHVDALVAMGWIRLRQGAVDDAHEHARMALHADPTDDGALKLLASIKARKNPLIGLWWRWSMWMSSMGDARSTMILVAMFVVYRIAMLLADDFGHPELTVLIRRIWLAFVVYTWVAPSMWKRMLEKDIKPVKLDRDY